MLQVGDEAPSRASPSAGLPRYAGLTRDDGEE